MLRQVTLLVALTLTLQTAQALGQANCKKFFTGVGRGVSSLGPAEGRPLIKAKAQPRYTKAALRHEVQGTVLLRVVMHSSGVVRDVCVIKGLPYGLTKRAVNAAYKIEFEPAKKEGRPVSVTVQIEYNFSTY